jgi:hypothetical protein
MKICQSHWDKLRTAMKDRGIDHLGAKSGQEVIVDVQAVLDGRERAYGLPLDDHQSRA